MKQLSIKSCRTISFLLMLLAAKPVLAQKPVPIIEAIYQKYAEPSFLSFDVAYTYTSDTLNTTNYMIDQMTGSYTMSGRKALFRLGDIECMQNDSLFIAVYHNDKMIVVGDAREANASAYLPMKQALDSLIAYYEDHFTVSITKNTDSASWIEFTAADSMAMYDRYRIEYNDYNKFISSIEYSFRQYNDTASGPLEESAPPSPPVERHYKLRIDFTNYRFDNMAPSVYSTNSYVWKEDGEYKPVPKYNDYRVYNTSAR